jgi:catechol 2,3-dioxygenase-like lactoylglutathione lyase family enzyme
MIKGISNVWLPVDDMQRSLTFYRDTLGLKVRSEQEVWAELELDGLIIGLNARDSEQPGPEGGAVVAFSPSGTLEEEVERLQGEGVQFVGGISEHPWGRLAAFHDPDGNSLELYEPPKG